MTSTPPTVDFGFAEVTAEEKTRRVGQVFSDVAPYYDRMNDLMSAGAHRWWKRMGVFLLDLREGMRVLDLATGSGDLGALIRPRIGREGALVLADVNAEMLARAARRLPGAASVQCDGECLPFPDESFDRVVMAFGLRNVTRRDRALREICRVLRRGGRYGILEFSPTALFPRLHRLYLTRVLPTLGRVAADDAESYRYLGESILRFPDSQGMRGALASAGLADVRQFRFAAGAVVFHHGQRDG